VAIRVFAGNTSDPEAFAAAVTTVRDTFGIDRLNLVGDRGSLTTTRISQLRTLPGMGWVTALRAPAIAALAADSGPLQMSLFDTQNFAEITHPDYPASGWSPAATPPWPTNAPANARTCCGPPKPTSTRSPPLSTADG
jgi:hypothetical protein